MSLEFLRTPFEKANYLVSLLSSHASGGATNAHEYTTLRHEILSMTDVQDLVPAFLRTNRDLSGFWSFIQPKFKTYRERRDFISNEFTPLLDYLEFGKKQKNTISAPAQIPTPNLNQNWVPPATAPQNLFTARQDMPVVTRNKRKVFIVHGRDNEAKQEVARFVSDLGLEPIILHEQASSGMTIIEKIERYTNEADFALVLYTPCDRGLGAHENSQNPRERARQNVVFEHGYLMAKLGRKNVCALVKGDIETPNDISGVVYVALDGYGGWKNEVIKELKACGYSV